MINKKNRKETFVLLLIIILNVFVRVLYLSKIKNFIIFRDFGIGTDMVTFDTWAKSLVNSGYYSGPFNLYPYFIAYIYKFFGVNYDILFLIQMLLSTLYCYFLYLIAKDIFNKQIGIIAILISSLYSPFIVYGAVLLKTSLILLFVSTVLLTLILSMKRNSFILLLLSGIFFQLLNNLTIKFVVFLPFIILWIFFNYFRKKKEVLTKILVFLIGILIIAIPLKINEYKTYKKVTITFDPGYISYFENFFYNNKLDSREIHAQYYSELGNSLYTVNSKETSEDFKKNKFVFLLKILTSFKKNFYRLFSSFEYPHNVNFYLYTTLIPFLKYLPDFSIIGPLGLIGIILSIKLWRRLLILYFFIFSYSISIVLTYVTSRYKQPLVLILIIFSSYTIFFIIKSVIERNFKIIFLILTSLVLLGVAIRPINIIYLDYIDHFALGVIYSQKGMHRKAINEFNKTISMSSKCTQAYNFIGYEYFKLNDKKKAIKYWKKSLTINPNQPKILDLLLEH